MRISDWSSDVCSSDLPSWIERIEIAPLSVLFPNWLVSATYKEPFEFDIPAMMASGNIPRNTPFVDKKATDRQNNTAIPNFAHNKTAHFSTDGSEAFTLIWDPPARKNSQKTGSATCRTRVHQKMYIWVVLQS